MNGIYLLDEEFTDFILRISRPFCEASAFSCYLIGLRHLDDFSVDVSLQFVVLLRAYFGFTGVVRNILVQNPETGQMGKKKGRAKRKTTHISERSGIIPDGRTRINTVCRHDNRTKQEDTRAAVKIKPRLMTGSQHRKQTSMHCYADTFSRHQVKTR